MDDAYPTGHDHGPSDCRVAWRGYAGVLALALALRIAFLGVVVMQSGPPRYLAPDSSTYLRLAKEVSHFRYFDNGSSADRLRGLLRPPGYPVFLAVCAQPQGWIPAALIVQAVLAGLMPVGVVLIVQEFVKAPRIALAAGLAAALSPTGVGIPSVILADLLFAAMFLAAFLLMVIGIRRDSLGLVVAAALGFSLAAYTKPVAIYWPWVSILVWACFAQAFERRVNWRLVGVFVVVQLLVIGAWSASNLVRTGTFRFSLIGDLALIDYLGAQVEATAAGNPGADGVKSVQKRNRWNRSQALALGHAEPHEIVEVDCQRVLVYYRKYPAVTTVTFGGNVLQNVASGWIFFPFQLEYLPGARRWAWYLVYGECGLRVLVALVGLTAVPMLLVQRRRRGDGPSRRRVWAALGLAVTALYFAGTSGVVFWAGSRVVYPAEFAMVGLVALLYSGSAHRLRGPNGQCG